jgi:outer membrane receptor for Fe3+-dicitrate
MNKQSISCDGATEKLSYSLTTTHLDTNGYRENSEYRGSDFGAKLTYKLLDNVSVKLSTNYHDADLGLPGHLSDSEYNNGSRRDSRSNQENNDVGEHDCYFNLGLESLTFDFGVFNLDFSYRTRWSDTYWGTYSTLNSTKIDTFGFTPNYTCTLDLLGRPNKVIV